MPCFGFGLSCPKMASRPLPPLAIMTPMTLDSSTCYRALRARDARFDGRFFVAVSSTHIYCRPVCTVKPPRLENCRFYPSAAAAEVAGFRPCLRCRPELAPGNASVDATTRLAQAAASLIEEASGPLSEEEVRHGLEGNLCRCTGYQNIVKAVIAASEQMKAPASTASAPIA